MELPFVTDVSARFAKGIRSIFYGSYSMRTLNEQEMQQVAGGFFFCLPKISFCLPKIELPKCVPTPPKCEPKPPKCEPTPPKCTPAPKTC